MCVLILVVKSDTVNLSGLIYCLKCVVANLYELIFSVKLRKENFYSFLGLWIFIENNSIKITADEIACYNANVEGQDVNKFIA